MKLNIHKIQCVLQPGMEPEDLVSLEVLSTERRGRLLTLTVRGTREEIEAKLGACDPVFFECIPLTLEEILSVKRRWQDMTSKNLFSEKRSVAEYGD